MLTVRKALYSVLFLMILSVAVPLAQASVIIAQLIDENPGIRGLTYEDGALIQDMYLGDEFYSERFSGFVLLGTSTLKDNIDQLINIYDLSGKNLIATLAFGGNLGTNFVHTSYYSSAPGVVLSPLPFSTLMLSANGTFQTVLDFIADNGDQYIFQYKSTTSEIPEPTTLPIFFSGLLWLIIRQRFRIDE